MSYRVKKLKELVESLNGDRQLRYQINSTYYFLPDQSPGVDPYTDVIVNVNFVVLVSLCKPTSDYKVVSRKTN